MAHVATLTIDHTKVPGDLTDYVVGVINDSDAGYAELYALCLEGGGDIRVFKDDDTTELAREIVSFSASAETGEIYIKYSGTLSSTVDTDIHIYADGTSANYAATDTYGRNAVWSAFQAVQHMEGNSNDSTSNARNGTDTNISYSSGKLGQAAGTTSGKIALPSFSLSAAFSVGIWINLTTAASIATGWSTWNTTVISGEHAILYVSRNTPSPVKINYTNNFTETSLSTTTYPTGTWTRIWVTHNGTTPLLYINGALVGGATGNVSHIATNAVFNYFKHGVNSTQNMSGSLDETYIINNQISANWITTEYNNQNSPSTFYDVTAISAGSAYTQQIEEAVTVADTVRRAASKILEESRSITDTVRKATSTEKNESITIADAGARLLVKLASIVDGVTVTDSLRRAITKTLEEATTIVETIRKNIAREFNENSTITDVVTALTATYSQLVSEVVTITDAFSRTVGYVRNFTETVNITEYFTSRLNGINAAWSDLYSDTVEAWSDLYHDN